MDLRSYAALLAVPSRLRVPPDPILSIDQYDHLYTIFSEYFDFCRYIRQRFGCTISRVRARDTVANKGGVGI